MSNAPDGRLARLGLIANCCAVFMTVMDSLIVNVALESMQKALGANLSHLQWVVDAYTLTYASCLLAAGTLGDRVGYRRMFDMGLWIFILASAACGLAPSLGFLVAARALQGAGAALLLPNALSLLNHTYQDPAAKAKAVGIWACCSSAGASAGPVVGGFLVGTFGWRSIFFVNIPLGILTFVIMRSAVREVRTENRGKGFDWVGQGLGVLALGSLTYAIIEGRAQGLSAALAPLVLLGVSAVLFGVRQRRGAHPMVPAGLLRIPAWFNANLVAFLICFTYYGFMFMTSLYFQVYRHFSPMATGLAFLPMTVLQPFLHPFLGRGVAKVGPRLPMTLALCLSCLGFAAASQMGPETPKVWLAVIMVPIGLGSSLGISPALVSLLRATPKECSGAAAGIFNTGRQAGALLGVAALGAFLGTGARFLSGFHVAVLVSSALMIPGILGTLAWTQNRAPGQEGRELDLNERLMAEEAAGE